MTVGRRVSLQLSRKRSPKVSHGDDDVDVVDDVVDKNVARKRKTR